MNLNTNILNTSAADAFKAAIVADIEKDFIINSSNSASLARMAWILYPTQDEYSKTQIRAAIVFSKFLRFNTLIIGPSGTGKELLARILSHGSQLRSLNMAGLTDTLFESTMFGYAPGSFTGALAKGSTGFLRSVEGGIAFLDEIGELPLSQQAKLLRVIQDKEVMPVGAFHGVPIKCRFIFATNRDLLSMVKAGTFREDLYFRISQLTLQTRSLKQRGQDEVDFLTDWLLKDNAWQPRTDDEYVPLEWLELGNVRALFNILLQRELDVIKLPTKLSTNHENM